MIKLIFDGVEVDKDYYRGLSQSFILFDKSFCLGSVPSNTFKIVLNAKANVKDFDNVKINLDDSNYADVYYDDSNDSNGSKDIINLSDKMMEFEFDYDASPLINASENGYVTILEILEDICSKKGVTLVTKNFNLKEKQVTWYDSTISARKYISFIATLNGGFARINRDGNLELVRYTNDIKAEININTCLGYKIGEYHKITRVVWDIGVDKWEYGNETGDTLYLDTDNPFITEESDVESIYNLINGFEFFSVKIDRCPIDSNVNVGDTIAFRNGNKLYPFIAQLEYSYNGGFRGGYDSVLNTKKIEETSVNENEKNIKSIKTRLNRDEAQLEILAEDTTENRKKIEDLNTPILTNKGNNHLCLSEAYETDAINYTIIGKCEQNGNPTSKNPIEIKTIKGTTGIDVNHEGNWLKIKVSSKNLLNLEAILRNTSNGLTNVINEDGSVTTSGVITSNYVGITDKVAIDDILTDNEYYTISQKEISDKLFLQIEETNKTTHAVKNYSTQNKLSGTLKINKDLYSYKIVILTNTMSNWGTEEKSITNFYQLEKGDKSTDYERYKEKEIFVDINKPNLFNFLNIINKSNINANGEIVEDPSQAFDINFIKVIPKKKYKLVSDYERQFVLSFYKDIPKIGSVGTSRVVKSDTFSEIVTVPDDYNYLAIRHGMDALTTEDNSNLKIHEGHDSFYELNSIKEVSDDLESSQGVLEKRIGKIILDGTTGTFTAPDNSNENFIQVNIQIPNIEFQCSSVGDEFLCTHFSYYEKATSTGKEREGLKLFNSGNYYAFVFSVSTTIATTIEEFKNWLRENPITIYYILKEPETIHLTPTKIPLFENENHLTLLEDIETKTDIKYHKIHAFNEAFYTKEETNAQLQIKANEINLGVESNKTEMKNGFLEINEKLGNYALQQTLIEQINSVLAKITDSEARISILNQTIQNGVPITKTETGYTFDINGLNISSTDAEVNSTLSSLGLSILDNISKEVLLYAGYDKDLQETIVKARNMIIEKYFTVAHCRIEEFKDPVLGIGTGFFYVE